VGFSKEFIVDTIKSHDEKHGYSDVIAIVAARWKITHSDFPNGFVYHGFVIDLDLRSITEDNFTPADQVTNEQLEQWCVANMTPDRILQIENNAIIGIERSHKMNSLTTYYQNPDVKR
jgi:hypothetical protein